MPFEEKIKNYGILSENNLLYTYHIVYAMVNKDTMQFTVKV
jgi:hypothetical protein